MVYALELRKLHKRFGKTEIIRGAELAVGAGERIGIIGPNGAGKSTLFNLISGRFGPTGGEILLNGKRIDGLTPFEINRLGLARSFQITNIFGRLSVFENLRCGVLWSLGYRYAFWKFLAGLDDAAQVLEHREAAEDIGDLEAARQPEAADLVGLQPVDALAVQQDLAAGGAEAPADEVEQGRLACAVGSDDRDPFSGRHGQVGAADDLGLAERFSQCLELDRVRVGRHAASFARIAASISP